MADATERRGTREPRVVKAGSFGRLGSGKNPLKGRHYQGIAPA